VTRRESLHLTKPPSQSMHRRFSLALISAAVLMSAANLAYSATTAASASPVVAVGPQYDTTHVYVAPADVDRFVASFLATFGGQSTKQVVATVTPTPSSTTSQLLQTPDRLRGHESR
jgi:hypothetical protein